MTSAQTEHFRQVVLNFLAIRHVAAFTPEQIGNRIRADSAVDETFSNEEVHAACDVLEKLGYLRLVRETEFAVTAHYQATGKGVIESERWRFERGLT